MSEKIISGFSAAEADTAYRTGGPAALSDPVDTGCCHRKDSGSKSNTKDSIPVYRKLQQLESPHLAKIISCEEQQDIGMVTEEYISGETLDEKLHRQGVMPPELVKYYIRQLLEALEQIHAQGIVHRDISPKNVLISTDGVVKLLDFDIARRRKRNQNADTTILGTVGFASPEQYGFLQTDATADIYALGVLMNVMLEGRCPMCI